MKVGVYKWKKIIVLLALMLLLPGCSADTDTKNKMAVKQENQESIQSENIYNLNYYGYASTDAPQYTVYGSEQFQSSIEKYEPYFDDEQKYERIDEIKEKAEDIEVLQLSNMEINNGAEISQFTNLKYLYIYESTINDSSFLLELKNLECLRLSGVKINNLTKVLEEMPSKQKKTSHSWYN